MVSCIVSGQLYWSMVSFIGPWSAVLVLGQLYWPLVSCIGPWSAVLVLDLQPLANPAVLGPVCARIDSSHSNNSYFLLENRSVML